MHVSIWFVGGSLHVIDLCALINLIMDRNTKKVEITYNGQNYDHHGYGDGG